MTRICLIGPESTGKTELAEKLANHLGVIWVPEFAREYALARNNDLTYADVEPIARGQLALHDAAKGELVIHDTDLISTVVYSRHYYSAVPEWVPPEAWRRKSDLYLLMDTDVAWRPDAARDSGGEAREEQFDVFRRALDEFETEWTIVSGGWEERWRSIVGEISSRNILQRGSGRG
jgi:NadR type nicotinamide-nucleotide adenylyltransferase